MPDDKQAGGSASKKWQDPSLGSEREPDAVHRERLAREGRRQRRDEKEKRG